jgi:hypothetical protein
MQVATLRREQESHREAEAALSRAEHQVLGELLAYARAPFVAFLVAEFRQR